MMYKTEGIIIRKDDFGEWDRILTLFTKDFGKIKARARGIKKGDAKLKGHLELLNWSEFSLIKGRSAFIIASASSINSFPDLRSSLKLIASAYYIAELINEMVYKSEKDYDLWRFITNVLSKLDKSKENDANLSLLSFEFGLLRRLGYLPQIIRCADCGKNPQKARVSLSRKLGGIVCQVCKKQDKSSINITDRVLSILRLTAGSRLADFKLEGRDNKDLIRILGYFPQYITQNNLRSKDLISIVNLFSNY